MSMDFSAVLRALGARPLTTQRPPAPPARRPQATQATLNTLKADEFAKLDLLSEYTGMTLDGGLYRVEVRRCPATGLTLKGTFHTV